MKAEEKKEINDNLEVDDAELNENSANVEEEKIEDSEQENQAQDSKKDDSQNDEESESDGDAAEEDKDDQLKAKDYLDKLQRLQAEFDNFRKREEKQRLVYKDIITENVVQELFPVIDNFERATHASKNENTTLESFVEGMSMVHQQFESFLTGLKIKRMDSLGEEFDPEKHDAVSKTPSSDYEEDCICQVLQNGWELNDKVIRHAMVVVSSGKPEEKQEEKK